MYQHYARLSPNGSLRHTTPAMIAWMDCMGPWSPKVVHHLSWCCLGRRVSKKPDICGHLRTSEIGKGRP
jgi:hypothetical protein